MKNIDIFIIIGNDGEYIPITSIATINISDKVGLPEDQTIDRLRDDFTIRVTLHSGIQHYCSMNDVITALLEDGHTIGELSAKEFYFQHVHSSWIAWLKRRQSGNEETITY